MQESCLRNQQAESSRRPNQKIKNAYYGLLFLIVKKDLQSERITGKY
jgi:hypothetical protein